jgi:hypothetical protein
MTMKTSTVKEKEQELCRLLDGMTSKLGKKVPLRKGASK